MKSNPRSPLEEVHTAAVKTQCSHEKKKKHYSGKYHLTPVRMAITKKKVREITSVG